MTVEMGSRSATKNCGSAGSCGPTPDPTAPISAAGLRYLLAQLNEDPGGGGRFEQLAVALVHRRKAPNIKPATPPSLGGDLGVDARTTKTLVAQEPLFRLYETLPEADERWIFAFSIEKKWRKKVESDLQTIRANKFSPSRVIFVTTVRIHPEKVKIQAERALKKKFKVEVEILDGSWIETLLLTTDYYLAVLYLGAQPAADPELESLARRLAGLAEAGMTDDEAHEVARLETSIQYFNSSTQWSEHFFRDVTALAAIQVRYSETRDRALLWYRLAWERASQAPPQPAAMDLAYAYLRALVSDRTCHEEMLAGVDLYISMVIGSDVPYYARGAANLLIHLAPTMASEPRWTAACCRLREWCRRSPPEAYGIASRAYAADAALMLDSVTVSQSQDAQALSEHFRALTAHLVANRNLPNVPLGHWASALAGAAGVCSGEPAFDLANAISHDREGDLAVAKISRDRAVALARSKRFDEAIRFAAKAQAAWFAPSTHRGFVLMGLFIARCFEDLERPWAARAVLLQVWHVATNDPHHRDLDLMHHVFLGLYNCSASAGWWRECVDLLRFYYAACGLARIEPAPEMAEFVQGVVPILLTGLGRVSPRIHDLMLARSRQWFPSAALTYEEITLATDETFESWLNDPDISPPQRDSLRRLRAKTRGSDLPFSPPPVDEGASTRVIQSAWGHALGTSALRITVPNDRHAIAFAVDIAAQFEAWCELGTEHNLCVVDDVIQIDISYGPVRAQHVVVEGQPDGSTRVVVSRDALLDEGSRARSELFAEALRIVSAAIIGASLDAPEDVVSAFAPEGFGEARRVVSVAAPPSYILMQSLNLWIDDEPV
jgi:hypothetical protein